MAIKAHESWLLLSLPPTSALGQDKWVQYSFFTITKKNFKNICYIKTGQPYLTLIMHTFCHYIYNLYVSSHSERNIWIRILLFFGGFAFTKQNPRLIFPCWLFTTKRPFWLTYGITLTVLSYQVLNFLLPSLNPLSSIDSENERNSTLPFSAKASSRKEGRT